MKRSEVAGRQAGWNWRRYLGWIGLNAGAEFVGLGVTALLFWALAGSLGGGRPLPILLSALVLIGGGALVEGGVVGLAQGSLLRAALPGFRVRPWLLATVVGAGVAWALGMVPSTLIDMGSTGEGVREPAAGTVLVLAAAMGLVLGPVLGGPQAWVLRRWRPGAWLWVVANALAWAVGMVVVFAGMDLAWSRSAGWETAGVLAATLVCAGAVVGAVHGAFLFRLLPGRDTPSRPTRTVPPIRKQSA